MAVEVIDSSTVKGFLEDTSLFDNCVKECFEMLDGNGDGLLSKEDIQGSFCRVFSLGYESRPQDGNVNLYEKVFDKFDEEKKGEIDREKFKSLMKEVMLAMARGIGDRPVIMALQQDSLLFKAVQHQSG